MQFSDLKIGTRLGAGFALLSIALVGAVLLGVAMLSRINTSTDLIAHDRIPKIALANQMLVETNDIAIALRNMMLNEDEADRKKQIDEIMSSRRAAKDHLAKFDQILELPQARELLKKMVEADASYTAGQDGLLKHIQGGDLDAAKAYLANELRPRLAIYKNLILEQIRFQTEATTTMAAEAEAIYLNTRSLMLGVGAAALVLAAWIGMLITRSITRPIAAALKVAHTVASGDLTSHIDADRGDELGELLKALKAMNDSLVRTVSTVRSSAGTIAVASSEVAAGSQDLSSRTEQQASSLEETASSMEELTSTVKQNSDNAQQANTLASAASSVAVKGGEVISQVVSTMQDIHASASKITDIITVIDGIAFQTNILALNAAVEAARAGEQGRGFAVVASEVRSLAQRSAAAAKEIKALIDDSTSKVATGSELVDRAGRTMSEIVDSVKRVTDIMAEITCASYEQTSGIEQVNTAIAQMDQTTQQNAALVEQAAAASEAVKDEAARLDAAVAVFRLADDGAAVKPAAPRAVTVPAVRRSAPRQVEVWEG